MDVKRALKQQYLGGLAMLRQTVERCPDDLWRAPTPPIDEGDRVIFRSYWRIAFHAVYFTHLYLAQDVDAFLPWPDRRAGYFDGMWVKPWEPEPYEFPEDAEVASRDELLQYISFVETIIGPTVDGLDLSAEETGIPWYTNMSKLSHEIMNIRHLEGHVGQLSELLMARGIDIDWVSGKTLA